MEKIPIDHLLSFESGRNTNLFFCQGPLPSFKTWKIPYTKYNVIWIIPDCYQQESVNLIYLCHSPFANLQHTQP